MAQGREIWCKRGGGRGMFTDVKENDLNFTCPADFKHLHHGRSHFQDKEKLDSGAWNKTVYNFIVK